MSSRLPSTRSARPCARPQRRQSGLAPLFADVEQVVSAVRSCRRRYVPRAAQVLALRVPLDENLTAADVKQAFVRSGVLFEPRLAAARTADSPPTPKH